MDWGRFFEWKKWLGIERRPVVGQLAEIGSSTPPISRL